MGKFNRSIPIEVFEMFIQKPETKKCHKCEKKSLFTLGCGRKRGWFIYLFLFLSLLFLFFFFFERFSMAADSGMLYFNVVHD